jgi:hypothetical protein
MSAGNHDFNIYQNETFDKQITITNSDSGDPLDLTGHSAKLEVRDDSDSVITTFDSSDSSLSIDGSNGIIELEKTPSETSQLSQGRYDYDLRIEDAGGVADFVLEGTVTVYDTVTQ